MFYLFERGRKIASKLMVLMTISCAISPMAYGHGGHGPGGSGDEEAESGMNHIHLPIEIGLDGSVSFGYGHSHGAHGHGEGEGDHGDHDGDHGDHDGDHGGEDGESHDEGLHWSIAPVIALGGDRAKKIVCLDEKKINLTKKEGSKKPGSGQHSNFSTIQIPYVENCESGYRVSLKKDFKIGLGAELHVEVLPAFGGVLSVGFLPYVGGLKYTERFVPDRKSLKKRGKLKLPTNQENLSKWSEGDRMVITTTGGITFNVSAGIDPAFHFGPVFHAAGKWQIKMKKIMEDLVQIKVSRQKLKSLAMEVDGTFSSVGIETFQSKDRYFNFTFDVSNPNARKAIKYLLLGSMRKAQEYSGEKDSGVSMDIKGHSLTKGKSFFASFSFPFLFGVNKVKAVSSTYGVEENITEERKTKMYMNVTSNETKTSGIASRHRYKMKNFFALYSDEKHKDHNHVFYGGTFKWLYEKDGLKPRQLGKRIRKLSKLTGLLNEIKFEIPDEKMGYGRLEYDFEISKLGTEQLLAFFEFPEAFDEFEKKVMGTVETLIAQNGEDQFCRVLGEKKCAKKWKRKTRKSLEKIREIGEKFHKSFQNKNYKEFVKQYGKLGTIFFSSSILTKAFTELIPAHGITVKVWGEKVPQTTLVLKEGPKEEEED